MNSLSGNAVPAYSRPGDVSFDNNYTGLTGIVVKGFLLSLVTFGIYRFWYMTNLRRFFWSRTLVDGSPAEYTGTGKELFLGFLVALAILVPIYIFVFVVSLLSPQLAPFAGLVSFALLFVLGQFALYRGRRYRAMRTLWRGIRLGQDGSGLAYAARAAGWSVLTMLTLGLAFPWMRASLERYRIDHTLVGTSRMSSSARGTALLPYWLIFYAVSLLPVLACVIVFLVVTDFHPPSDLLVPSGKPGDFKLNPAYAGTKVATSLIATGIAAGFGMLAAVLLVPYYRARETRLFMNSASLGPVQLFSRLRAREFYWPYIVYFVTVLGAVVAFVLVAGLLGVVATMLGQGAGNGFSPIHAVLFILIFAGYLGGALLFAVLYVRMIQAKLWSAVATSTWIEDPAALAEIVASARGPGSGLSEGLADALDVGGAIEIGL